MFTGIITERGTMSRLEPRGNGARLTIKRSARGRLVRGESIAVNGVCLTVASFRDGAFTADLSEETLDRTALGRLQRGARLNLERPLRLIDRLGGHLVQGHVDAVGELQGIDGEIYRWTYPREFTELVVSKGSIAVNGVSLTIVDPDSRTFGAALIPETLRKTNLGDLQAGDPVNLEFDVIAKFVRRLAEPYLKGRR